jgi:RNA polymerase sigma-70 factor, ECF subfamily
MELTMSANPSPAMECAADQDLALVEASKRGDVVAFEELVCRYDRMLLHIAQIVTQNLEEAQEVVQIAFVKAFKNLSRFPGNAKLSAWLIGIALNESLVKLRKGRAIWEESPHNNPLGEDGEDTFASGETFAMHVTDWAPCLETLYSKIELRDILTKSLRRLPATLRLIFVLRDVYGHSVADTSEILSLTPAAVQTRLSRSRMQLRQELNQYFKDQE